jgi:hypothetical protein
MGLGYFELSGCEMDLQHCAGTCDRDNEEEMPNYFAKVNLVKVSWVNGPG